MKGFTKVEVLTLVGIMAVLVALAIVLLQPVCVSQTKFSAQRTECMSNVMNIVGLLEFGAKYPVQSGPNLILYLVKKGEIDGEERLNLLFCPGDKEESLKLAGGVEAYLDLDLTFQGEHGHLTSYAGRNQFDKENAARKQSPKTLVLICDDSEDHHDGRGFVVGLTGGAVQWRDKVDDWDLPRDAHVKVGADSVVEELRCLRSE